MHVSERKCLLVPGHVAQTFHRPPISVNLCIQIKFILDVLKTILSGSSSIHCCICLS